MTAYLDCNATTPVMREVADLVYKMMVDEYGNASSRTHEFGLDAKRAVERAREQVANTVNADKTEVFFTSGATESNNIAILGLKKYATESKKTHIITTKIEHKAVLEPIEYLEQQGFDVTYLNVGENGLVNMAELESALRDETFLVSIMHINNETGCIQPIEQACKILNNHDAFFHVDAAQSFGKYSNDLHNKRIDFISASGHKLYAPNGIGGLIIRKRGFIRAPLTPLMFGGGQERNLRPGTLATPLIAGFGLACEIAAREGERWQQHALKLKKSLFPLLDELGANFNGENISPFVLNFSIPGVNSEAVMLVLKGIIAVSNGSACTSKNYTRSHVLTAMGLSNERIDGAIRMSWCHMTPELPIDNIAKSLTTLMN